MTQLERLPVARWASRHPRLAAWLVLSVGMVGLLVFEARDVGLLVTQWIALIVATVLVAGLCIWIVSWEDNNEDEADAGAAVTEAAIAASSTAPANAAGESPPERPDAAGT